jgi:hypothetical protein
MLKDSNRVVVFFNIAYVMPVENSLGSHLICYINYIVIDYSFSTI